MGPGPKGETLTGPALLVDMSIYQIQTSDPSKACGLDGKCFWEERDARYDLFEHGFQYSKDSDIFHNGATEAWLVKRKLHF